jgi:ADP-ribose pyrophosphatase
MAKVFETEWFSIEALPFSSGRADNKPYYCLSCNDSVGIVAQTAEKKIILTKQYRPPIGDYLIELPSGYVDNKESPVDAAKRELLEETGFVCDAMTPIGGFKVYPSRINNTFHVFFGKGAISRNPEKKEDNAPELLLVSPEEFIKMISEKKCIEISSIGAFLMANLFKLL